MNVVCKRYSLIVLLMMLTIIVVSCGGSPRMRQMADADAMIGRRSYDSAIARLNTIDTTRLSNKEWAYYHLLETTAKQKSYIPIGTDTIINKVIDYYERNGSGNEKARAYMAKSIFFDDIGNAEGYSLYLKKAEKLATDIKLQYEIIAKIAGCNQMSNNLNMALEYARKGMALTDKVEDIRWRGFYYYILMRIFREKSEEDSVSKYTMLLENTLDAQPKDERYIYSYYVAEYYHKHSENEKAIEILKKSIEIQPQCANYALMAMIYDKENRSEEAEKMWQEAIKENEKYLKAPIMQAYSEWLLKQGQTAKAAQLLAESREMNDEVERDNSAMQEQILKVQSEFDKQDAVEQKRKIALLIAIGAAVIIATIVAVWAKRYRNNRERLGIFEGKITDYQKKIDSLQTEKSRDEAKLKALDAEIREVTQPNNRSGEDYKNEIQALKRKVRDKNKKIENLQKELNNYHLTHQKNYERGKILHEDSIGKSSIVAWGSDDYWSYLVYMRINETEVDELIKMVQNKKLKLKTAVFIVLNGQGIDKEKIKRILNLSESAYRTMKSRYMQQGEKA